jgi:hypothetical protein
MSFVPETFALTECYRLSTTDWGNDRAMGWPERRFSRTASAPLITIMPIAGAAAPP